MNQIHSELFFYIKFYVIYANLLQLCCELISAGGEQLVDEAVDPSRHCAE